MHSEIQTPVELVISKLVDGEDAAIAWPEVKLHGKRDVEFVFQSEEAVCAGFAVVDAPSGNRIRIRVTRIRVRVITSIARFQADDVVERLPVVADAAAQASEPVQTFVQPSLVHEVRGDIHRPQMRTIDVAVLRAQIDLDGEMVGGKGFVGKGLRGTKGQTDAFLIGSLCVSMERDAREKGDEQSEDANFFHNDRIVLMSYPYLLIKKCTAPRDSHSSRNNEHRNVRQTGIRSLGGSRAAWPAVL